MLVSAYRMVLILLLSLVLAAGYNRLASPAPIPWVTPPRPGAGGASTSSSHPSTAEGGLTAADVKRAIESGLVKLVDARSPEEFAEGHIPGALNLPIKQYKEDFGLAYQVGLRQEDDIIVYCKSPECDESVDLTERLTRNGFTKVRNYAGGIEGWKAAGGPVEKP